MLESDSNKSICYLVFKSNLHEIKNSADISFVFMWNLLGINDFTDTSLFSSKI